MSRSSGQADGESSTTDAFDVKALEVWDDDGGAEPTDAVLEAPGSDPGA